MCHLCWLKLTTLTLCLAGFILLPLACLVRGVWFSGCGLVIGGCAVSVIAYYYRCIIIIIDVFVQLWNTLYQMFTFPGRNGAILLVVLYLW